MRSHRESVLRKVADQRLNHVVDQYFDVGVKREKQTNKQKKNNRKTKETEKDKLVREEKY